MTLRIAALGLWHEANTFSAKVVTTHDLQALTLWREDMRRSHANAQTTMAGFLSLDQEGSVKITPLVFAQTTPSGPLCDEALRWFTDEIRRGLAEEGP